VEDLQLALTTARVDQRNFGLWINNWQVGQTLNALVTGQLASGELLLRVAGQQITATADIPIQQGANLMLEVKQLQPVPTLRVLNPLTSAAPSAGAGATLQLIPGGGSAVASSSLAAVAQVLQASQGGAAMLPAPVGEAISELLRLTGRAERLGQPAGLAAALRGSGIFLEAGLASVDPNRAGTLQQDVKAGLFRALSRVDAAISKLDAVALQGPDARALLDLKQELEGGLGRIILHQLNSQPLDGQAGLRSWQLELPVFHAGTFHSLRIELEQERRGTSDSARSDDEEDIWRVALHVAPPALGALELKLELNGEKLDLRIAAARAPVRVLLDAGLSELQKGLASRGITLVTTATAALVVEAPVASGSVPAGGPTLDLRA
jgi:hypothetical protein